MINGDVDIAVHSMKMFLRLYHKELCQAAVLERANTLDILVKAILIF
jgi:porphobilinogen deaminase